MIQPIGTLWVTRTLWMPKSGYLVLHFIFLWAHASNKSSSWIINRLYFVVFIFFYWCNFLIVKDKAGENSFVYWCYFCERVNIINNNLFPTPSAPSPRFLPSWNFLNMGHKSIPIVSMLSIFLKQTTTTNVLANVTQTEVKSAFLGDYFQLRSHSDVLDRLYIEVHRSHAVPIRLRKTPHSRENHSCLLLHPYKLGQHVGAKKDLYSYVTLFYFDDFQ